MKGGRGEVRGSTEYGVWWRAERKTAASATGRVKGGRHEQLTHTKKKRRRAA